MAIVSGDEAEARADGLANLAFVMRGFVAESPDPVEDDGFWRMLDYLLWETCIQVFVFPGGRYGSPFFPDFDAHTFAASTS